MMVLLLQVECPEFPADLQHWVNFISASSQALRAEGGLEEKNKWSRPWWFLMLFWKRRRITWLFVCLLFLSAKILVWEGDTELRFDVVSRGASLRHYNANPLVPYLLIKSFVLGINMAYFYCQYLNKIQYPWNDMYTTSCYFKRLHNTKCILFSFN